MTCGASASYYHYDGNGGVRILTDGTGAVTDTKDFLANGERYDRATELYYLRARYMEPGTGTFLSMDPSEGGVFDPPSLHKYLYAHANPVTYSDPTGYFSLSELVTAMKVQSILIGVNLFPMVAAYGWAIIAMNDTAIEAILRSVPVAALAFDTEDLLWDVLNWNGDSDVLLEDLKQMAWDVAFILPILKVAEKLPYVKKVIQGTQKGVCFAAGTLVLTENGETAIEEIRVGDLVYSEDPLTAASTFSVSSTSVMAPEGHQCVHWPQ